MRPPSGSTIRTGPARGQRPSGTIGRGTVPPRSGVTRIPSRERPSRDTSSQGRRFEPGNGNPLPSSGYRSGPARGTRYTPRDTGDGNDGNPGNNHDGNHGGHHGGGHHGGHHGGGYYGGSHGYYGGYLGFGSHYYGYGYGSYYPFYGYNYYSPYLGLGFGYSSPYYRSRYVRTERVATANQGALDLNIKPRDAEVYLNGYFVGTAGDFDGWPRYLWVDEDVHELIFYKEGYETLVREISIQPEAVINLKLRMQRGNATPPQEVTRYVDEREYRSRQPAPEARDRQRRRYEGPSRDQAPLRNQGPTRDDATVRRDRPNTEPAPGEIEQNTKTGRLQLTVTPPEASVYIDGRFVGIGGELTALGVGLLMDPGEHEIQIFHPEHETQEESFEVTTGKETKLEIDLTSD